MNEIMFLGQLLENIIDETACPWPCWRLQYRDGPASGLVFFACFLFFSTVLPSLVITIGDLLRALAVRMRNKARFTVI
ncbi:hypothetical protein CUMW_244910 [Citrus unshiu]|uniref:Uncharacterized protein n=1 Tax=Citrus unshiu TaxID=55188 RepID=A0A2H5QMV3_CITUN|nr:hypothetical protein CUMW_244910 [Citrus unshiu]